MVLASAFGRETQQRLTRIGASYLIRIVGSSIDIGPQDLRK
jgi:hypothetical protein